jgi:hypothetical protein
MLAMHDMSAFFPGSCRVPDPVKRTGRRGLHAIQRRPAP